MDDSSELPKAPVRPAISWRSVVLGLSGTLLISIITPYNDYVLFNTFVIGNGLPLGAMLLFFLLAVVVNGPLSRFCPAKALSSGELGVAFGMVLVGCAIPSSGVMRYLPASLVYPFWQARSDPEALKLLESVRLPRWLYPAFSGAGPAQWMNDPVVTGFAGRWTGPDSPPYWAWWRPMLGWGVYVGLLYGAMLCLLAILRRQWYENERLPFPLASIELALVEAPPPGKWLNATMGSRAFMICFAGVFVLHAINGLHTYWPRYWPEIPTLCDLQGVFSESPWRYMDYDVKRFHVYLTAAGVSYFLPGSISFSMWFCYLAMQLYKMMWGTMTGDPGMPGANDEVFGGILAYLGIVIWIGRRHWWLVMQQAFRGVRAGEPQGRYLSYRGAFWGLVLCMLGLMVWTTLAGADPMGAVVIVISVMVGLFIVARIVAETGLLQPGTTLVANKPFMFLGSLGLRGASVNTVFAAGHLANLHHDVRESIGVFASHAIRVNDQTAFQGEGMSADTPAARKIGRQLLMLFGLVLLVSYVSSFSSMLWTEYTYGIQKNTTAKVVNEYGAGWAINGIWTGPTMDYANNRFQQPHSPAGHATAGAGIVLALSVLRLAYVWWPVHPIGFLCMTSWPIGQLWFGIFLGSLARTLVLKFGGARMYLSGRKAMVGIIAGEAVAAGLGMVLGMVISQMGGTFRVIRILPE